MKPQKTASEEDFCDLLKIPANAENRAKLVQQRLIGVGCGQYCSRCGGSGHYSFNLVNGTTCFGCKGSGYTAQKLTAELFAIASEAVAKGDLDSYLDRTKARSAAIRDSRGAQDAVMEAWTGSGVSKVYDWMKASKGVQPDADIADRVNRPMCDLYTHITNLSEKLHSIGRRKVNSAEERVGRNRDYVALAQQVAEEKEKAIKRIQELTPLIQQILDQHAGSSSELQATPSMKNKPHP